MKFAIATEQKGVVVIKVKLGNSLSNINENSLLSVQRSVQQQIQATMLY